jgi:hypothetical protein
MAGRSHVAYGEIGEQGACPRRGVGGDECSRASPCLWDAPTNEKTQDTGVCLT